MQIRAANHQEDLRRALIAAGLALMEERGNWDFSLRDLAHRAGAGHTAPYTQFDGKADLMAALAASGFEALQRVLAQAARTAATPDAALMAIGLAYVRFGLDHPAHYRLMFGASLMTGIIGAPQSVQDAAEGARNILRIVVRDGLACGALRADSAGETARETIVLGVWSLIHGLTKLILERLPGDPALGAPDAAASAVLQIYLDGLRPQPLAARSIPEAATI